MISFWGGTLIQECPWGGQNLAFWRDFRSTPIHTTWVPIKSRRERFIAPTDELRFVANFWFSFSVDFGYSREEIFVVLANRLNPLRAIMVLWSCPDGLVL